MYLNTALKEECRGCTACVVACPVNAIAMQNEDGFCYPLIDADKCIHCGLCERTCRKTDESIRQTDEDTIYYGWNKNHDIRRSSTSGGAFAAIVQAYLRLHPNAWVFGAVFNDKNQVVHIGTDNVERIPAMCRSKYLQSNMSGIYREVIDHLKQGHYVLFSGTPCQVAGLKALTENYKERLFTVDFICHGVSNPDYFAHYLDALGRRQKSTVKEYSFRNKKSSGVRKSFRLIRIRYENNKTKLTDKDLFVMSYKLRMFYRESCYGCIFASKNRCSDVTMGDFWGLEKEIQELKQQRLPGISMVKFNTEGSLLIRKEMRDYFEMQRYCGDFRHYSYLFRPTEKPTKPVIDYEEGKDFITYLQDVISLKDQWRYTHPRMIRLCGRIKAKLYSTIFKNV